MAQNPKLVQAQLSTTTAAIVTAQSDERLYLSKVVICNVSSNNVTYSLWIVPSGGSPSNNNIVISQRQLTGSGTVTGVEDVRELAGFVLNPGWSLRGNASANSALTIQVQAVSIT